MVPLIPSNGGGGGDGDLKGLLTCHGASHTSWCCQSVSPHTAGPSARAHGSLAGKAMLLTLDAAGSLQCCLQSATVWPLAGGNESPPANRIDLAVVRRPSYSSILRGAGSTYVQLRHCGLEVSFVCWAPWRCALPPLPPMHAVHSERGLDLNGLPVAERVAAHDDFVHFFLHRETLEGHHARRQHQEQVREPQYPAGVSLRGLQPIGASAGLPSSLKRV